MGALIGGLIVAWALQEVTEQLKRIADALKGDEENG
jgi:hypothetical protein